MSVRRDRRHDSPTRSMHLLTHTGGPVDAGPTQTIGDTR